MAYLLFAGDMLVMAFMIAVVIWISVRDNNARIDATARLPLEDD